MQWYLDVLKNYAVFNGRARRKEFWMFTLVNAIFMIVLRILTMVAAVFFWINALYALFILIPSIAVQVRRLHDVGKSGWWILLAFIPIVGAIVLIVFDCMESKESHNEHGTDPKLASNPGM
ncbi:DUF805 domain-containing protein [Metabacillus sp. GX 13764]|uniref:DUF805 domain-containing protein n=1 Tax=Metabacillus kandeliae TaxID=2900151 RepID=UPI001E3F3245|nr:DUF805 domain-containing protein [Metabacillus kandeliae]MCD7035381.1 DUF805 domain-containing protein [Metabacillus kandeliae]